MDQLDGRTAFITGGASADLHTSTFSQKMLANVVSKPGWLRCPECADGRPIPSALLSEVQDFNMVRRTRSFRWGLAVVAVVVGVVATVVVAWPTPLGQAAGQTTTGSTERRVLLPAGTPDYGTSASVLRGTVWRVARLVDAGEQRRIPPNSMVNLDGGTMLGSNWMLLFDGCHARRSDFVIDAGRIRFEAPPIPPTRCTSESALLTDVLSGTRSITPAKPTRSTTRLIVANGKQRVELVRAAGALADTGWVLDSVAEAHRAPSIAFGPTQVQVDDGCNTISAAYLAVGSQLVTADFETTAADCSDNDALIRRAWTPEYQDGRFQRSGAVLTITFNRRTSRYHEVGVVSQPVQRVPPS